MRGERTPWLIALLFVYVAIVFSGLEGGYLKTVKFDLTYVDMLAAGCCFLGFVHDGWNLNRIGAVLGVVIFAIVYFVWGLMVSADPVPDLPRVINHLVMLPLVGVAVSMAAGDRGRLQTLVGAIQVVAIVNAVVCVLQILDVSWVAATARPNLPLSAEEMQFINFRAVGLWGNQNEAARFFVYSVLLSYWARRPFAWPGRIASVGGLYLTASRFGALMLIASLTAAIVYMVTTGRTRRVMRSAALPVAFGVLTLIAAVAYTGESVTEALVGRQELANTTLTRSSRILDLADENADPRQSHSTLTLQGLERAADGDWYGAGLYSFQRPAAGMLDGTHNMYIMMWGETGLWGLIAYPLLLLFGVYRVVSARLPPDDKFLLLLLWTGWIAAGFVNHVEFESPSAYVMWALLFVVPGALSSDQAVDVVRPRTYRLRSVATVS